MSSDIRVNFYRLGIVSSRRTFNGAWTVARCNFGKSCFFLYSNYQTTVTPANSRGKLDWPSHRALLNSCSWLYRGEQTAKERGTSFPVELKRKKRKIIIFLPLFQRFISGYREQPSNLATFVLRSGKINWPSPSSRSRRRKAKRRELYSYLWVSSGQFSRYSVFPFFPDNE